MNVATNILIYDDQCPMCVAQMRWLERLDWLKTLRFMPASNPDASNAAPGLGPDAFSAAMYCVSSEGKVCRGAYAFRHAGMRVPLLAPLALIMWIPGMMWIAERVYRKVSTNRYALSRFLGCQEGCDIKSTDQPKPMPMVNRDR